MIDIQTFTKHEHCLELFGLGYLITLITTNAFDLLPYAGYEFKGHSCINSSTPIEKMENWYFFEGETLRLGAL